MFGEGGGKVARSDGLPIGGVVLIKLGNERGEVARLGGKFVGMLGDGVPRACAALLHGAGEVADAALGVETVADGEPRVLFGKRGKVFHIGQQLAQRGGGFRLHLMIVAQRIQHRARANRWQLVGIAQQNHAAMARQRGEQLIQQVVVHHRGFVNQHAIQRQRVVGVVFRLHLRRL